MHGLHDLVVVLLLSLIVVLEQVDQIALFEESRHPIFLGWVFQDAVSLKYTIFELTNIQVSVLEELLPKAIQLGIGHIASFYDSQLKFILVTMRLRIVPSMYASED